MQRYRIKDFTFPPHQMNWADFILWNFFLQFIVYTRNKFVSVTSSSFNIYFRGVLLEDRDRMADSFQ